MRKIESSIRREVESYQQSGHSLESALDTIRSSGRRGVTSLLDAMYGEAPTESNAYQR